MAIFRSDHFVSHSGIELTWKVECEALDGEDWGCLATLASRILPPFGEVEGIPRGGLRFAEALKRYVRSGGRLLIVDDVCTTGRSFEDARRGRDAVGVVAFARSSDYPRWVVPIWTAHFGLAF